MRIIAGASKPNHFKVGAEAIMWWEETAASHVYMRVEVVPGVWVVYHAVGSGSEFWCFDNFREKNTPMYEKEFEVSLEAYQKLIGFLVPRLKIKYSQKHLVGLFYKRAVQYALKKKVNNPFKDKEKSEVCIEAMCLAMGSAKLMEFAEDPEDMGMFEVLQALKSAPGKEILNAC